MGNANSSSEDTWCKVHPECKHYQLNLSHVEFDVDISKSIGMDNISTSNISCTYPFCVAALGYHFKYSLWVFLHLCPLVGLMGLLFRCFCFSKLVLMNILIWLLECNCSVGNTVSVLCVCAHVRECLFVHVVKFCTHPVTFSRLLGLSKWNIFSQLSTLL